jgi:hypothetical protein
LLAREDELFEKSKAPRTPSPSRRAPTARAMPAKIPPAGTPHDMTLSSIADAPLREKVVRMQAIFPYFSVRAIFDALGRKNGHFDDACNLIASEDPEDNFAPRVSNDDIEAFEHAVKSSLDEFRDRWLGPEATKEDTIERKAELYRKLCVSDKLQLRAATKGLKRELERMVAWIDAIDGINKKVV